MKTYTAPQVGDVWRDREHGHPLIRIRVVGLTYVIASYLGGGVSRLSFAALREHYEPVDGAQ